jgi:glycosyltransferase involved in cell wall biosynthesis
VKRKIKVLITIPNFITAGSGNVVFNLAKGINREQFDIEVCTTAEGGHFYNEITRQGIKVHVFNYLAPLGLSWNFLKSVYRASRFFKACSPDIIHSYHYASEFSEGLAARWAGCRWIFTKKNMAWGNKSWRIRSALAHRIIATNGVIKKQFYGNRSKVEVIYSSVDISKFAFEKEQVRERNFIVVGNIMPIKGTEYIVKAFLRYAETKPGKLIFIGNDTTDYAARIKQDIAGQKNQERIVFAGKTNDIKSFYSGSFCLIMGSDKKGEGGPVALLEAMASGLLVIGADVAGINEQLENFPDLMFKPNDIDSLLTKMNQVSEYSTEKINDVTHALRKEIENRFTIETEIKKHEELYLQLAR